MVAKRDAERPRLHSHAKRGNEQVKRLLRPKSIAVIGGGLAAEVIRQCEKIGYRGELWGVNPKRNAMHGRPCFASLADLPAVPDAAFVCVPRTATIEIVDQLNEMGVGGAVCFASGFAEVGDTEGLAFNDALLAAIGDLAVVGPNCYGVLNYLDGVALWPDEHGGKRVDKGVAILTQSGNIAISMSMQQRSLPLGYLISSGNQAGITTPQYVEAFLEDERVTAIGIHLEGLDDVVAFSHAAIKALEKRVPLVVLKSGATDLSSRLTMSHTSSLAGADKLYDALFDRVGVVRVRSIPEFLETLKFLSVVGPLPSCSVATISSSGGEAALVADRAAEHGVTLPTVNSQQKSALVEVLGERVDINNPLDYHTYIWNKPTEQERCFSAMLLGEQAVTVKILDYPRPDICDPTPWVNTGNAFTNAVTKAGKKGAVMATMPENLPEEIRQGLLVQGIAPMLGLEECLVAIRGAALVYERQQQVDEILGLAKVDRQDARTPREALKLVSWNEVKSKMILAEFGIESPASAEITPATSLDNLPIRYPVVLKILSDEIVHKSDVGGVVVGIANSAELRQAITSMAHLGSRFLVEEQVPKPLVEMILGITRDPQFGLALVIGAGGVLVELFQDSQTLLFPVLRTEVERALERLKIAPLLNGYRGAAAADKAAIIDAVLGLAAFAEANSDDLLEVDINPLFVYADSVLAVDAVIRMRENYE